MKAHPFAISNTGFHSDAIVPHSKANMARFFGQFQDDHAGLAVLDGVIDRFLGNAVQVHGDDIVSYRDDSLAVKHAGDVIDLLNLFRQSAQRRRQTARLERDRLQAPGKLAGLGDGVIDHLSDF